MLADALMTLRFATPNLLMGDPDCGLPKSQRNPGA